MIKDELKVLYKKDKNLASQVAKALGYRVSAKKKDKVTGIKDLEILKKQAIKDAKKIPVGLKKVSNKFDDIKKRLEKGSLDDKIVDVLMVVNEANRKLSGILALVMKELRF